MHTCHGLVTSITMTHSRSIPVSPLLCIWVSISQNFNPYVHHHKSRIKVHFSTNKLDHSHICLANIVRL